MILEPGTYVGADCRLLETARLRVDESSLTGESIPVLKKAEVIEEADIPLADRKNIVYMGTLVTGGQGRGIVVATGRFTEIGKLQAMIGETIAPQTPMEKQLNTVGNQLVWVCGAICALVFMMGLLRRTAFALIFKTTISLAVAAVPEGLPDSCHDDPGAGHPQTERPAGNYPGPRSRGNAGRSPDDLL